MEAIMLAAGIGSRLSPENRNYPPKCLLDFDGKSLLARHIEILRKMGTKKLTLITGYRADDIEAELSKVDGTKFAQTILNPNYQTGTIASLHCAKKIMQSGEDILVMDADVLCHPELIKRLTSSKHDFHILYDRNYEVGADPVLLCLKGREIIEFGKYPWGDVDVLFFEECPWHKKWYTHTKFPFIFNYDLFLHKLVKY